MSSENNQLPEPRAPEPPEVEAETAGTALEVQKSPPAEPAPPEAGSRSPGLVLLAIFAAVLAIASVTYFSRGRAPLSPAPRADDVAPAVRIELPAAETPVSGGPHDAPGPINPSPDKIFNDAASVKETLGNAAPATAPQDGFINELPPAPHASPDGAANDALRDAAKKAFKNQAPDAPPAEEPEALLRPYDARALAELEADGRRALALSALAAKARSGAPYADELRAYLAERQDRPLPARVADRAVGGVPTPAALSLQFPLYQRKALAAGRRAEAAGLGGKLGASLAALVNLRPSGPLPGGSTAAILSRAEAAIAAHDLALALAEIRALRPEAAGPLKDWTEEAGARVAVEAALDERERALLASLAGGRL